MVNTKDYLNLSALAYVDFESVDKGKTIGSLVDGVENGTMSRKDFNINSPEFSALQNSSNPLLSYTLIHFEKDDVSGFAGAAFQSPSGEIVFSFKGTDAGNGSEFSKDIANADEQIFTGSSNSANENGFIGNTWNRLRGAIFVQFIKVSSNKREHSYV